MRPTWAALVTMWQLPLVLAACTSPGAISPADVTFDSAVAWVRQGADSARLEIEVAASREQHEVGLAGRSSLPADGGMLFLFDPPRSAEDGFWMWRTSFPLDIAFIDDGGTIRRVLAMEPCTAASQSDCPGYFPDLPYASALEVNRGWFTRNGVGVGSSVRVE